MTILVSARRPSMLEGVILELRAMGTQLHGADGILGQHPGAGQRIFRLYFLIIKYLGRIWFPESLLKGLLFLFHGYTKL